ncbi:hypothetical protein ACHAXT_009678 [Thalassiosira profunda]
MPPPMSSVPLVLLAASAAVADVAAFGVRPAGRRQLGAPAISISNVESRCTAAQSIDGITRAEANGHSRRGRIANQYHFANIQHGRAVRSKSALAAMADVPDENNASDSPPSSPELQSIQAWLATHLPALPPSDLQRYAAQLLTDGFTSPAQLNEINTGRSGRMEDLYFMKKGHRRVLLKKLGLVRTMRGQADNRIGREGNEGGDIPGERGGAPLKGAAVPKQQPTEETLDTSIEEWLAEQNRMVEERRLARLAEEERLSSGAESVGETAGDSTSMRKVKAKRVDRLRDKFGAPSPEDGSRADGAVDEDSPEEDEDDYDLDEEEVSLRSKVDVASPFEHFRQKTQQTSSSEERSLERLRRDFAEKAGAEETVIEKEEELVDDLTARYQSLDAGRRGGEDAARDKQERRLEELRSAFRQRHNQNAPADLTDDVTAWHPSLDKASAEERSRELNRLEELRRASLRRAAAARAPSEEAPPDDLSARYDALDKDALEDGAATDKSSRRMDALRREFARRKAAAARNIEATEEPLDDLSARYRSLTKDALEDGAARDKPSRRLEAIKMEFARRRAAAARNSEAQKEPLDDLTARYQSMGKDLLEDGSARDKGSRRLEEMKREFARRKAVAARNIEAGDDPLDDVTARYRSMSKDLLEKGKPPTDGKERKRVEEFQRRAKLAADKREDRQRRMQEEVRGDIEQRAAGEDGTPVRKSNEERRLEDIERYFHKRRAARSAEEERRERTIVEAKTPALEEDEGEFVDDARAPPSVKDLWEAGGDMALDDGFFEERPAARSLSTTLPPTNKGGGKYVGSSASKKDGPLSDADLDEYVDITKHNIRERESLSLSTTMPPTNRAVNATRAERSGGSEEECIDEDCWDITRSSFPARSQSLSTTLPPQKRPANSALPARTKTELSAGAKAGSGDDAAFDITQNLFPEGRPPDASAFEEGEKSEMNDRPPPKRSESATKSEAPTAGATASDESDQSEMNNRASELYQRFRSERRSSFSEDERSDMNSRPPPRPASGRSAPSWARTPGEADDGSVLDILSQFPKDRPSASVNTGAKRGRFTTSGTYEESKRSAPTDDDSSTDIRMNFSKERPSALVNTGTERETEAEPRSGEIPERSASRAREVDDSYMDIMTSFPQERPSMLVNTGTKKDRVTTSGSYGESKEKASQAAQGDDSYMDIMSNFPKERPAALVNTHTARRETPTYDDESCRNIAQHFSTDTASLRDHPKAREIGSSSPSSGSTASNDESYRNIAHNFSTDGKSLRGHPQRKDIGSSSPSSEFLDVHRFSGKLSRGSQAKAAATTAAWRDPTAVKSGEKFLDTPPAFADSLDMMLSSAPGAGKKRSSPAGSTFPSTSVRSSSTLTRDLKKASATASQPFLDKPRVFQSGVDMKSSNYSGKRFKRSSDIPPEEKNVKDEFEVATEPLPDVGRRPNGRRQAEDEMSDFGRMRMTKERKSVGPSTEEPFTDITRSPWMARLERATSAVKDANKASKGRSGSAAPVSGSSGNVAAKSKDKEDEESSFEQVMWWLLGHLPKLQEEDAISYFQSMLEDGFDSLESLEGLTEDDLHFMKSGHRRALLRSVRSEDSEDADAKEDVATDAKETTAAEKPDATIDKAREELEKTEAWIAEQNRLVEERLAARLAEDKASTAKKDEGAPTQRDSTGDFVGRASMSAVAPDSMLTRDPYPDRPSLSSLAETTSQKKSKGAEEDEAFDITREAFGDDRPSSILSASSEPESTDDAPSDEADST